MPTTSVITLKGMAANNIDSDQYVDGSIDTVHIGDDQVTGAKLNPALVTGDIIYSDGTDTINRLAKPGTPAGEVLTFATSATAPSWVAAAGGGAWTKIGTQVASNSASLTQTGLDSTYDTYAVALSDLLFATDGQTFQMQLGDSSGIDVSAGDYGYCTFGNTDVAGAYGNAASVSQDNITLTHIDYGNATGEGLGGLIYINSPSDGAMQTSIHGHVGYLGTAGQHVHSVCGGGRRAVISHDRVLVMSGTGNITTGRMTVWGISHA